MIARGGALVATLAALVAIAPNVGCVEETLPPLGQVVLYVTTDAPLPPAPGEALDPFEAPPLFDRVRFEIYYPGEDKPCPSCVREFDLDRGKVDRGEASVGIVPRVGATGYRARVRMFRAITARLTGDPLADGTVDVTVALPPVAEEGLVEASVVLRTEDVGQRLGVPAPIEPALGPPPKGMSGTWAPAKRVFCNGEPREGEVCVPGGTFWMGSPHGFDMQNDPVENGRRLVTLSPFFMSTTEITVAAFRASGVAVPGEPRIEDGQCTYTAQRGAHEARPVTCITWERSRAYCQAMGGDLPTEAQFEYVSGALGSRTYPWGDDEPSCDDAIFGFGIIRGALRTLGECDRFGFPLPPGHGARDRLLLPGATEEIQDLAGNVGEWTRDVFNDESPGPCWRPGVVRDPFCETGREHDGVPVRSTRGGSMALGRVPMRAQSRSSYVADAVWIGFRCVREAK